MFKDGKQVFSVGDIVEITEESDATGMLDFKKWKGYPVLDWRNEFNLRESGVLYLEKIKLKDESGRVEWYSIEHFKLKEKEDNTKFKAGDCLVCVASEEDCKGNYITPQKEYEAIAAYSEGVEVIDDTGSVAYVFNKRFKLKEGVMDNTTEKKECLFKEGQVVWDLRNGRGVVVEVSSDEHYPVKVKFDLEDMDGLEITDNYTADGRYASTQTIRSLYFSEPKIEAATEPVFEPVLKKDQPIILTRLGVEVQMVAGWVHEEHQNGIEVVTQHEILTFHKDKWAVHYVGEKIEFN